MPCVMCDAFAPGPQRSLGGVDHRGRYPGRGAFSRSGPGRKLAISLGACWQALGEIGKMAASLLETKMGKASNKSAATAEPQSGEKQTAAQRSERRSIEDRIADAEQELKRLVELKRRREREEREQRERELRELLKTEKVDEFAVSVWRAAMPRIRELLQQAATAA